jgi:23S rRNA (guanine2445-N2)-methyltransferase / 23S rRNA (guanine2069-N7)-methyltransferase
LTQLSFFAAAPKGLEALLAGELRAMGAVEVVEGRAGVSFQGPLLLAYRACLWSRFANRVLLPLTNFPAPTPEALYHGVREIPWAEHLDAEGTLAVDFHTDQSQITHSQFGALKVKDALVDQFRDAFGIRPSVAKREPDLRINVYLRRDKARLSLDLSGESLHRRGYREEGTLAPLKENLAAAILALAGWPEIAAAGGPLVDPMCGSGTLPIEGALMAGDVAPGLLRRHFGFLGWKRHDAAAWEELLIEARQRRENGLRRLPPIIGYDADSTAVRYALANVDRAGLRGLVHIEKRDLREAQPPREDGAPGLLAANPPYGERLGEEQALVSLYTCLGEIFRTRFPGWHGAVFTGNPRLAMRLGSRPAAAYNLYNGPIECSLLLLPPAPTEPRREAAAVRVIAEAGSGAEMLANRLRKNLKNLGRWARQAGICCYRLYDADLPEYAVAVDLYSGAGGERWAHVQEYEAPATVDSGKAQERLRQALTVIPEILEMPPEHLFFKVRRRQKGAAQYGKMAAAGRFFEVLEGDCRLLVNFTDYLDTGLFLDHRTTREMIGRLAAGKSFLNLFGYTGAATVHAAAGGAAATVTVDMSRTYLDWARRNLELNGFAPQTHQLVTADCLEWLEREIRGGRPNRRFGLIFLDPPTFSTSKKMGSATFDVQRDHVAVIRKTAQLLEPGGILIFSTNFRKFKMDKDALTELALEDITRKTIPRDFERNPRIHQCWRISRRGER